MRYRILEPVRQYGREKLDEGGEADIVCSRHAAFYLAMAEESETRLKEANPEVWLGRLEREHDNFRTALSWTLEQGEAELGLRLGAALGDFWHMRKAEILCEECLKLSRQSGLVHNSAFALQTSAALASSRTRPVRSARLWGAAEALREAIGTSFSPLELRTFSPT